MNGLMIAVVVSNAMLVTGLFLAMVVRRPMVSICSYCGAKSESPTWCAEHMRKCDKHPYRELREAAADYLELIEGGGLDSIVRAGLKDKLAYRLRMIIDHVPHKI